MIQHTDDVKMREDILSMVEKQMEDKNCQAPVLEVDEDRNAKLVPACICTEDVNLIEKISLLEVKLQCVASYIFSKTVDYIVEMKVLLAN